MFEQLNQDIPTYQTKHSLALLFFSSCVYICVYLFSLFSIIKLFQKHVNVLRHFACYDNACCALRVPFIRIKLLRVFLGKNFIEKNGVV